MIRHIVLTKFKPDTSEQKIREIYDALSDLVTDLPGASGFTGGRSESPEQIERGYKHGFVIDFESWAALKAYAEHDRHKAIGAQLVAQAVGGVKGILVLDIDVAGQVQ